MADALLVPAPFPLVKVFTQRAGHFLSSALPATGLGGQHTIRQVAFGAHSETRVLRFKMGRGRSPAEPVS